MNRKISSKIIKGLFLLISGIYFTGCYSVFSGGTGGLVVDAESTSTPKQGIANVDVYAYLSSSERNKDFTNWKDGTVFSPSAEYYGHTTTGNNGNFTISRIVWKSEKPDFGKDADFTKIYLLFYHENYGLTKGETVIISDGSTDTVYAELTSVRKSTLLNMNFIDVATGNNTGNLLYVKVSVPQTTASNSNAAPKIYEGSVAGSGNLSVSYPRWLSDDDKASGNENCPEITISYFQSGDEITWKGCYNLDNGEKNYAFRADEETGITEIKRTIKNSNYSLNFYGKSTKLYVPEIRGQYINSGDESDDGIVVCLKGKDENGNFSIDLGQTTTTAITIGNSSTQKHGQFSGLGNGNFWVDNSYTDKFATLDVEVIADTKTLDFSVRSDVGSHTIQIQ